MLMVINNSHLKPVVQAWQLLRDSVRQWKEYRGCIVRLANLSTVRVAEDGVSSLLLPLMVQAVT